MTCLVALVQNFFYMIASRVFVLLVEMKMDNLLRVQDLHWKWNFFSFQKQNIPDEKVIYSQTCV